MNENYGYNGPSSQQAIEGAFNILHKKFGRKKFNRKVSYSANDWSSDVLKFIKVDYDNIPLLNEPDLKAEKLKVLGFTKVGELFQFIEHRDEYVKIQRPGGWQLRNYGDWYQVRTLDGKYVWIFAKPFGVESAFASQVEKVIPQPVDNNSNSSNFPIGTVIIIGIVILGVIVIASSMSSSSNSTTSFGSGSSSSYSSSYDSDDSSSSSYYSSSYTTNGSSDESSSNNEWDGDGGSRRCEDCQSIDLSGWGFTSKGNGRCKECDGTGHDRGTEALVQFGTLGLEDGKYDCKTCYGTGQCQSCGGTGVVYN